MLDSFFRDMQNGTLHDPVDISGASGPLDLDGDTKADSDTSTGGSDDTGSDSDSTDK